jgi:hypothetical protein
LGVCKIFTKFYPQNLKRRGHLGDIGVDWRIILKYILKKYAADWMSCLRIGFRFALLFHRRKGCLNQPIECQILKKDYASSTIVMVTPLFYAKV